MVPSRTTNHQYGTTSIFSCNFSALSLLPSPGCKMIKMDLRNASTRVYQFCLPIDSSHLAQSSTDYFPRCNHIELPTEPLKNSGNGGHPVQSGTKHMDSATTFANSTTTKMVILPDILSSHRQQIGRVSPIRWNGWTCRRTWSTGRSLRKVNSRGSRCLADEPPDMF